MTLTAARLRELLDYDPKTGKFVRKISARTDRIGVEAGATDSKGYIQIRLDGCLYLRSRLAWMYVHGKWPPKHLDHINRRTTDDRVGNLRLATRTQNQANRTRPKLNTSGFKGITFDGKKWIARVSCNGERIYLGYFPTLRQAATAYKQAAYKLHGEFARW